MFLVLFPESKYTVQIKYWKDVYFKSNLISTLHFINIHFANHVNTHILEWIQIITKYIDIFFQLNIPLYSAIIWIPTLIWHKSVMTECIPFLENYVIPIGHIQYIILAQHNMENTSQRSIM